MKIDIADRFTPEGRVFYEWNLWDGPDGIDHAHGYASDLVQAFSKILEWHERIGADYAAEVAEDLISDIETARHFITNNETDRQPTN